jgi:hypothetical protein
MKRLLQFLIGGTFYFAVELIFRSIVNHRPPHITAFIMGGLAVVFILFIEEKLKINIFIKSLMGGAFVTLLELIVGSYYKFIKYDPLWVYGGITFYGIVSLRWSLLWCGLILVFLVNYRTINYIRK